MTHGAAVIWDVDGTLVDTAELHFEAWKRLATDLGQPFTRADFAATFGKRNPEIIGQLFGSHYSDREIADIGFRKEEYYRSAAGESVVLLPGVKALLQGLRAASFKQAIGSSAPRENVDLILRSTGTHGYFDAIVSMEDTDRGKPDPQVFQLAADRLRIFPAGCLVLEDAVAGVQAAKTGGMKCIAVTFVGHHSEESLKSAGADLVVQDLTRVSVQVVLDILSNAAIRPFVGTES